MTTFNFTAEIKIDPVQTFSYKEAVEYSYKDISVEVKNSDSNKEIINVCIVTKNNTLDEASFVAESELFKIANVLSWENTIKVKDYSINSIEYINENGGKNIVVKPKGLKLTLSVNSVALYSEDATKRISSKLSSPINPDFHDILIMWRESLAENSRILQFLLLYRILEYLNGGERSKADKYIRVEDKNISLRKGKHGEDISLYTYLRDNIHAKTPNFPFREIDKSLNGLRVMVINAIKKTFPSETV